jgi:AAA domain
MSAGNAQARPGWDGSHTDLEIPAPVADVIASWTRIMRGRSTNVSACDLLRRAAAELWTIVRISKTVHPDHADVVYQAAVDTMNDLALVGEIDPDDAQLIFAQAKNPPTSERPSGTFDSPPNKGRAARPPKRKAVMVRGDRVPLKSVQWAWKNRFAFGKLALLAGDPGLGKSQIALDIVARHTTSGLWPVDGGTAALAEAIVLTAEDGLSDTVAPRLVAAGADMTKVHFLTGTKAEGGDEELFDLTRDVEALRDVLGEYPNARIIVIDPLTAYLGETQAQRNSQVRKALAPLVRLIEETGVLVIGVTHLNKSQGKAIYRVLDSIAFVALGRILHLVIADADNPENRKFLCDKTNIGAKPPGLTFICQQVSVMTDDGEEWVSRISWGTQHINETADQALAAVTGSPPEGTPATAYAIEFLRAALARGEVLVTDLEAEARAAGLLKGDQPISQCRPLRDAKTALGVEVRREGFGPGSKFYWSLPHPPIDDVVLH